MLLLLLYWIMDLNTIILIWVPLIHLVMILNLTLARAKCMVITEQLVPVSLGLLLTTASE